MSRAGGIPVIHGGEDVKYMDRATAGLHGGQRALGFSALRGGGRFLPAAVAAPQDETFGGRAGQ